MMPQSILEASVLFDLLSKSNDGYMFAGDLRTGKYHWSTHMRELFAFPDAASAEHDAWIDLLHPDDVQLFHGALHELREGRIEKICGEYRMMLRDGSCPWAHVEVWTSAAPMLEEACAVAGIVRLIPEYSKIEPGVRLRDHYDFRASLDELIEHGVACGALLLGFDDFKRINDLFSYSFGDKVLQEFGNKLQRALPNGAELFRLDGDNFGIIFLSGEKKDMLNCFDWAQSSASQLVVDDEIVSLTVSGGICLYASQQDEDIFVDGEILYRNVRIAQRSAKSLGKNQVVLFREDLFVQDQFKMRLLERLRSSVADGFAGFSMKYQPLISAKDGTLHGCEALLRWDHPDFPRITPSEFVPVLENSGLMFEVGRWIVRESLEQCARWLAVMPTFQMNINITSEQFEDPTFGMFIIDALKESGVPPTSVTLELTESGKITNTEEVAHAFDFLRGQGIKIAFDDFGTGYASLEIFRVLSADELKIDRSFIDRITYDVVDQRIVTELINLCHSMNMVICVEGIETKEMDSIVSQLGPELLQGYYFNMPLTVAEFEEYYFVGTGSSEVDFREKMRVDPPKLGQNMVYAKHRAAQPMDTQMLIDNAHAGIFQVGMDDDFTFLTCNEGYRRMLGYTAKQMEELFHNRALGFVHPDDAAYVNEEIRRQLGCSDTVTIEFRVMKADGTPLWILGTGNVIKNVNGNPSLIVVIVENDRRKQLQLADAKRSWHHRKIVDNAPTGLKCVRYDEGFTIEYISDGFLSLLGYTEREIQMLFGGKYLNLIFEEDIAQLMSDIADQLKTSNVVTMRYRVKCKDGRLIWLETVSRLCPPDEDGIQRCISSVVDATETMKNYESNRSLNIANRYQLAVEEWNEVLFEYNLRTDDLVFSENYASVFGRKPEKVLEDELEWIHKSDHDILLKTIDVIRYGRNPHSIELRIRNGSREYGWYSVAFSKPDIIADQPTTLIGRMRNIDKEKREHDELLERTHKDAMTGLLNKHMTEEAVSEILKQREDSQSFALLVIDIDDFNEKIEETRNKS
ncbi:MAG: EAL domain-containing protein, partial [Raoultibacter sp.]